MKWIKKINEFQLTDKWYIDEVGFLYGEFPERIRIREIGKKGASGISMSLIIKLEDYIIGYLGDELYNCYYTIYSDINSILITMKKLNPYMKIFSKLGYIKNFLYIYIY